MRPIKFRAWDKTEKKMFDWNWMQDHNLYYFGGHSRKDCEIMQFTGLKDKNGKEIYEGDIVKSPGGGIYEYYFDKGAFLAKEHKISTLGYETEFEVIGNIYSDPHLLKELK